MNYNTFEKKYTASKLRLLFGFALRTFGLFLLIWTIKDFLAIFLSQYYAYYFIYRLLDFPADLILSVIIACLWIFPILTTVWVSKKEVRIRKGFRKTYTYSLLSHNFYFYKKEGNKKLHTEHLFLRVYDEEETEGVFRLYFFHQSTFTQLSSAIHAAETGALPVEVRSEAAFHDLQEGQTELTIPFHKIIRSEWKLYLMSSAILIITIIAAFLLRPYMNIFYQYFIFLLGIGVFIYIPIRGFQLFRNQKKCPHKLYRHGTFLTFDETRFSVSQIETIRMTASNVQSTSIYPKNRYILISLQGKKYKYWIGSNGTLSRRDYDKICQWIEKAFIHEPDKVVYEQR